MEAAFVPRFGNPAGLPASAHCFSILNLHLIGAALLFESAVVDVLFVPESKRDQISEIETTGITLTQPELPFKCLVVVHRSGLVKRRCLGSALFLCTYTPSSTLTGTFA
jgi:hypothetical protein